MKSQRLKTAQIGFLQTLKKCGMNVEKACREFKIAKGTHHYWLKNNIQYMTAVCKLGFEQEVEQLENAMKEQQGEIHHLQHRIAIMDLQMSSMVPATKQPWEMTREELDESLKGTVKHDFQEIVGFGNRGLESESLVEAAAMVDMLPPISSDELIRMEEVIAETNLKYTK